MEKTKKREFFDKERKVLDEYYDLIERNASVGEFLKLIKKDPDFLDPYSHASEILKEEGKDKKARELEDEAFKRALAIILDKNGNWPDEIPWGWIENRHIVRVLMRGADNYWIDGQFEKALDLYRKLFKSNLSDNIGARYAIAGLRMGLSYDKYMAQVWPKSLVPAEHILKWFRKNGKKFPEEYTEWIEYCKEELGMTGDDIWQ